MTAEREPTADEKAGIDWWNTMTEEGRRYWLDIARTATPAEAWSAYKRSQRPANATAKPRGDLAP